MGARLGRPPFPVRDNRKSQIDLNFGVFALGYVPP